MSGPVVLQEPPHASPLEAFSIVLVVFGLFIASSLDAAANWRPGGASGFTDASFDSLVGMELFFGAIALLLLRARAYPLRTLVPQASSRGAVEGAFICLAILALDRLLGVMLPSVGTTPIDEMLATTSVTWSSTIPAMVVNGVYEEVFLMGYLTRGLRRYGASTALGITLFVRLLYHSYQGPIGLLSVCLVGLAFGLWFQRTGRLFPLVFAHIAIDLVAFL